MENVIIAATVANITLPLLKKKPIMEAFEIINGYLK